MAREDPQLKLRLPPELKASIEDAAGRAGRSLNAEIVYRLAQSLRNEVAGSASLSSTGTKEGEYFTPDFVREAMVLLLDDFVSRRGSVATSALGKEVVESIMMARTNSSDVKKKRRAPSEG